MKIPKHLQLSRNMLYQILMGNGYTKYVNSLGPVEWGPKYISVTDCSGYIDHLIRYSYHIKKGWTGLSRPLACGFYNMIINERYFKNICNINMAKPGDFLVFKILPGTSNTPHTGHIMLIDDFPKKMISINPIISNYQQWCVQIIDQSKSHGKHDTRYNAEFDSGLGIGYIRLYTNSQGLLTGYSWTCQSNSNFKANDIHPIAIGRLHFNNISSNHSENQVQTSNTN